MDRIEAITIEDSEEYLRQKSVEVDLNDKNLKEYIKVLDEYCKLEGVMAMAAVQLGIPKRIVYLKNTNLELINKIQSGTATEEEKSYNEARVLLNPVIISREGLTTFWEACASCMDNTGLVRRPYKIEVEYYDIKGNKHNDTFEGLESTVLSHEMDHLDGILHIDIADELLMLNAQERAKLRQEQGYNIITKEGKYEDLLKDRSIELVKTSNN